MPKEEIGEARDIEKWLVHVRGKPLEEAELISSLMLMGYKQQDVAKKMDLSQAQVSKRLTLLSLSPALKQRVRKGEIKPNTAYVLSRLPKDEQKKYEEMKRVFLKDVEKVRRDFALTHELLELLESPIEQAGKDEHKHKFVCIFCGMEMKERGKE